MKPFNKSYLNFLLLLAALAIAFLLAEVIVRANPSLYSEGYRPSKNERLVYELVPGHRINWTNSTVSSQGLNDRYFSLVKPAGIYRIAVVGDSTSFGVKVGSQNSFPKVLESLLNSNGEKFEVMNFSVSGYNTSQESELIQSKVIGFQPDMIILVYCGNDTHLPNLFKPEMTWLNALYHKSFFVHFVLWKIDWILRVHVIPKLSLIQPLWRELKERVLGMYYPTQMIYRHPGLEETIYIDGDPPKLKKDSPPRYWYMLGHENYRVHLTTIHEFLKQQKIEFISSGFMGPKTFKMNQEIGVENIFNFEDVLRKERIEYNGIKLPNDGHMNAEGHRLVARHLYGYLRERFDFHVPKGEIGVGFSQTN